MRNFVVIWAGQLLSLIGSGLSRFAFSIWIYQQTGSATQFGLVLFFATLPRILCLSFAGALIDRWNRKAVLIASDVLDMLRSVALALLFFSDRLEPWHVFVAVAFSSAVSAFQAPALSATIAHMVRTRSLARANGLMEVAMACDVILSPLLAAYLLVRIGVGGLLLIDALTFLCGMLSLLAAHVPTLERGKNADRASVLEDALHGWKFVHARPVLWILIMANLSSNLLSGFANTLMTPMLLEYASVDAVGMVISVSGVGLFLGGLLLAAWGGPRRKLRGVLIFIALSALSLIGFCSRESILLACIFGFGYLFCFPIIRGCSEAFWQASVPLELQGRVFAVRKILSWSSMPLGYLMAGPIADHLFEPLLRDDGALASTVGAVLGVGPGRGTAFLLLSMAAVVAIATATAALHPAIKGIETADPDGNQDPAGQ